MNKDFQYARLLTDKETEYQMERSGDAKRAILEEMRLIEWYGKKLVSLEDYELELIGEKLVETILKYATNTKWNMREIVLLSGIISNIQEIRVVDAQ